MAHKYKPKNGMGTSWKKRMRKSLEKGSEGLRLLILASFLRMGGLGRAVFLSWWGRRELVFGGSHMHRMCAWLAVLVKKTMMSKHQMSKARLGFIGKERANGRLIQKLPI